MNALIAYHMFFRYLNLLINPFFLAIALISLPIYALADSPSCDASKIAGSYTRTDVPSSNLGAQQILTLDADGNAYWSNAEAVQKIVSGGTYMPLRGTWVCVGSNQVVWTVMGYSSDQSISLKKDQLGPSFRRTGLFDFNQVDMDHPVLLKVVSIQLNPDPNIDNPLDPNAGTVVGFSAVPRQFQRIQALPSDFLRAGL